MTIGKLGIGEKIRIGSLNGVPIIWLTAGRDRYDLPGGTVTLASDRILKLMAFDAMEPSGNAMFRREYGNNNYLLSNIRQWMNSNAEDWFREQHGDDAPPAKENVSSGHYADTAGFLYDFNPDERAVLLETPLDTVLARIDGGEIRHFVDKIFLLSPAEIGLEKIPAGPLPLFVDKANGAAKPTQRALELTDFVDSYDILSPEKPWYYWLRLPYYRGFRVQCVNPRGSGGYEYAYCGHIGFRPACNVAPALKISDDKDSDGAYTLV